MTEIQNTAPRRSLFRPAVLAPVLGLAAAAAVAIPLLIGGGAPAYAIAKNPDGTLSITFNDVKNAKGLESDLRAMGYDIKVDYVPDGKQCSPKPRSQSWVPKDEQALIPFPPTFDPGEPAFPLDPRVIKEGQVGVLMLSLSDDDRLLGTWARVSNGPVADCTLVDSDGAPLTNEY
ncbi:hypothetical protein ACIBG8_49720 [Nonomuraea sp. NPDC050556]|uniref:hypothetical protein n=1 Tax=Nonomuraea sp. NPDC050556 TaxID=3364369 RepID=UPI00378B79BF